MSDREAAMWEEYDMCAEWCTKRALKGEIGDPLPGNIGGDTAREISNNPEEFKERVRQTAYAICMNKIDLPDD